MKTPLITGESLEKTQKTAHYVYLLECVNGHYYTGYTTDIDRRYQEHQKGSKKCSYTRSFPPKRLAASWCFDNKSQALKEEARIKKLTREDKIRLVAQITAVEP
jgi:putative endonuclease